MKTRFSKQNRTTETTTVQIVAHYLQSNTDSACSAEFSLQGLAAFSFSLVRINSLITAIIHYSYQLFLALAH
jgi:hypothetical protein